MFSVLFRNVLKIFFLFFIFFYLIFFVVLGYRFERGDVIKKDNYIEILFWSDKSKVLKINNNKLVYNDKKLSLFFLEDWCYNLVFSDFDREYKICLDWDKYFQLPLVKVVSFEKVNYLNNDFERIFFYNKKEYSDRCIKDNVCFSSFIRWIYNIKRKFLMILTKNDLYICNFKMDYCDKLYSWLNNYYFIWYDKNWLYFFNKIDKHLYLLKLK